ncbi:MAG: hypothetical protein OHK0053_33150 [Microscillaceae bacterium]
MTTKGKIAYQSLGPGFWGLIGDDGQHWRPLEMPAALKKEGLRVEVELEEAESGFSVFMWGTPVQIIHYTILS